MFSVYLFTFLFDSKSQIIHTEVHFMAKNHFTRKILITLALGLIVGIGFIFLREYLISTNHQALWTSIDKLLFVDISAPGNKNAVGIFYIVSQIFMRLLQIVLVPLIFTSIIKAIDHIRESSLLNKLATKGIKNFVLLLTVAVILGTTVGYFGYSMGWFQLSNLESIELAQTTVNDNNPLMIVLNAFNNNFVSMLSNNGNIIAVVVFALIVGVVMQSVRDQIDILRKFINEVYIITMKLLEVVIVKFGPFAVFALLVRTLASYGTNYLQPAMVYMVLTSLTLLVLMFVVFPLIVLVRTGLSPVIFLKKMYKVIAFGFSTSSSAATLPLTQETVMHDLGVDEAIASFIVPLASAINMTGTAIMQIVATLFIASVGGYEVGLVQMISIIALVVIGSISTPAAPGAGAVLLFTIISGMGYVNPEALAAYSFIFAINRPVEMLVTAANVMDDGVSALCVAHELDMVDETLFHKGWEAQATPTPSIES